ncbi:MAG: YbgC/FadM family acyl-CoA thioesterase [Bdellovibrionales bacterium]
MSPHTLTLRIFFEDTDAQGVVYHANYLRLAERARSEWLRSCLEPENDVLWPEDGPLVVVRHLEIDYLASAKLEDIISIETRLTHLGSASFKLHQTFYRDKEILTDIKISLVCISRKGKVLRIPASWREKIEPHLQEGV